MKNLKLLQIGAIAVIVLGIIHLLATPMVSTMVEKQEYDLKVTFIYMFLGTGLATALPGLVIVLLKNDLKENSLVAIRITIVCALVVLLLGIGAFGFMPENPFALIALLLGIYVTFFSIRMRKTIKLV